jgi:hypothetical protein
VLGVLAGAAAAEHAGARRAYRWVGRTGIAAVGISVAFAAVLSREPFAIWLWLVPVTIGPALAWSRVALAGPVPDTVTLRAGGAAALTALAHVVAAEAVLGALGCTAIGATTWGSLLSDGRVAGDWPWPALMLVGGCVVGTVTALRAAAAALRAPTWSRALANAGTMS